MKPVRKKFCLLNFLPPRFKRMLFVTTLYTKVAEVCSVSADYKVLTDSFIDLIPNEDTVKFPVLFTDKIWKQDQCYRLTADNIFGNHLTLSDILEMCPDWLEYSESWMNDDVHVIWGILLTVHTLE